MNRVLFSVIAVVGSVPAAQGAIFIQDLGTAAPPATLPGFTMTPFPLDPRPLFANETTVPSPLGGDVVFGAPLSHRRIGAGWATWSHGYTGDVYARIPGAPVTLTLPADTGAFYFYAEPNQFATFNVTATAQDGTTLTVPASGSAGARGFGFYTTAGTLLSSITVSSTDTTGYAIGEFGIARQGATPPAVPEPASVALLGLGTGALAVGRRLRKSA